MSWLDDAAAALSGGPEERCGAGHDRHATTGVPVRLMGQLLPDWPTIPPGWGSCFHLTVFDAGRYEGVNEAMAAAGGTEPVGYCPGDDEVSRSVLLHGGWEGYETVTAMALLVGGDGVVVDVGAHVGWYTMLAARAGYDVLAVEAAAETCAVLEANAAANGFAGRVRAVRGFVGSATAPVAPGQRIRLLKVDIEGLEWEAARVFEPALRAGDVDFALVELTPIFDNSRWEEAAELFDACGYDAHLVASKAWPDPAGFGRDVPGALRALPFSATVAFRQENVVFARRGLL